MIRLLILLAALLAFQAPARALTRYYAPPEIDALLAPVALYPDPLLSHVLVGATYPDDLHAAAAWSRANPQLTGEDAVRAAEVIPWHESVKTLLAFPELLYRMDESAQWTADLGAAFLAQQTQVMDSVQELRRRAQAAGYLQPDAQVSVQQQGQAIAIYPAQPQAVYVPYYDPYVVYGPVWWTVYRPVYWRPWYPRTANLVPANFLRSPLDWQRGHISYRPVRQVAVQPVRPVTIDNAFNPAARLIVSLDRLPRASSEAREVAQRVVERRDPGRDHHVDRSHPVTVVKHVQQAPLPKPIVQPAQIPKQAAVQNHTHNTRPIAPVAPVVAVAQAAQAAHTPAQAQRPVQSRVETPRPVAVQHPAHPTKAHSLAVYR